MRRLGFIQVSVVSAAVGCGGTQSPTSAPPAAPATPPASDKSELDGTWKVVSIEAAGSKVPDDRVKKINLSYTFACGKVTTSRPDRPASNGSYAADATTNPKKLVLTLPDAGRVNGLFAIEGTTLKLCLAVDGGPPPTVIESKASPKTDLLTLERQ